MLFNHNTLSVDLDPTTKSIEVRMKRDYLGLETLFELEGIFSWLTSHLEVRSVLLTSEGTHFCKGMDTSEWEALDEERITKNLARLSRLVTGMLHLPQTVVVDLKTGASNHGIELALGADIRIGHSNCRFDFDYLAHGLVPCSGGIGLLSALVGPAHARNWLMSGRPVDMAQLLQSGLALQDYDHDDEGTQTFMQMISRQSPVARIQAKRGLLETVAPAINRAQEFEFPIAKAAMQTGDWKKASRALKEGGETQFTCARDFSLELKRQQQQQPSVEN
jgi:enoyl-CoA hydratase/carnithine racemase